MTGGRLCPWRVLPFFWLGMLYALHAFSQVQTHDRVLCAGCDPLLSSQHASSQGHMLDDFESLHGWNVHQSEGVDIAMSQTEGKNGKAL